MKWKNRLTNYNFWISIVSAVLLILQNFNVQFDIANFNELVTAVLGLLVVIGIINDPTKSNSNNKNEDNKPITTPELEEDKPQKEESFNVGQDSINKEENIQENTQTQTPVKQNTDVNEEINLNLKVTPIGQENENNDNYSAPVDEVFIVEELSNQIKSFDELLNVEEDKCIEAIDDYNFSTHHLPADTDSIKTELEEKEELNDNMAPSGIEKSLQNDDTLNCINEFPEVKEKEIEKTNMLNIGTSFNIVN